MNAEIPERRPATEEISGLIERVTFHNDESGFCVLRVKARGQRDETTVVGSLPSVTAGEWLSAEGWWVRDKEHGLQFKATTMKTVPPTTVEGIERYLSSGLVKGIGPVLAKKLVGRFGAEVLAVIEDRAAELQTVDGIGPKRRERIANAWQEAKQVREIMLFLHSHGVSTSRAVRIFKTYGERAIETVRNNPYVLAKDIYGIGFATADQIAQKVGIPRDSLNRARAGIDHVLLEATSDGHCALPLEKLKLAAVKLLEVPEGTVEQSLSQMLTSGSLLLEEIDGEPLIFLLHLRRAEEGIAARIKSLAEAEAIYPPIDFEKAVAWCEQRTRKTLAPSQREALKTVLSNRVVVITGGPGVGKTTLVNSILMILRAKGVKCLLCAPTGRAAKRLTETTGLEAKTIHRLLEIDPATGRFSRNESNTLACGLLVVDETSMVDVPLMHSLVRALPSRAGLILVGDVDQLPSVGPGTVLQDLIESGVVPVVRLTEVFRQAAGSHIITNAHRIRRGQMPDMRGAEPSSDFHFVERDDPEKLAATLVKLVHERIPERFHLDPIRDVQVLCPMNRGSLGVRELNTALQRALNPAGPGQPSVERFGWRFQIRDKVIQTENDYDKDVFNGDVGIVERIDLVEQQVMVRFDNDKKLFATIKANEQNSVIGFVIDGQVWFIERLPDFEDRIGSLRSGEQRRITAVMVAEIGSNPTDTIADVRSWMPLDILAVLGFGSGVEVGFPWIEIRDSNGQLIRRLHGRPWLTTYHQGDVLLSKFDVDMPNGSGIGTAITQFHGLPEETRQFVAVTMNHARLGSLGSHLHLHDILDHLIRALECLCKELGLIQKNLLPILSSGMQSKVRAVLDDAGREFRELARDARNSGQFDDARLLETIASRAANSAGTEKKFGLAVVDLLQKFGLRDAEVVDRFIAANPRGDGLADWASILSIYRGATIHEGYMDFTKKHDVNDVIRICTHLKDVITRVILKMIGYNGTYEPVTMRSYGPHRLDWVEATTEPWKLGFK